MNSTPDKSIRLFEFCTLAGTQNVRLENGYFVGCWKNQLIRFYGPRYSTLIEKFVNSSNDDAGILSFTKRYGPLERPQPGKEFRFPAFEWKGRQEFFRASWDGLMRRTHSRGWSINFDRGNEISYIDGRLVFVAVNLATFLTLDLYSRPRERLRKCCCPGCPNPYFIASHLGQNYCGPPCAKWAQRQWKKQWWQEHGKEWLKTRKAPGTKAKRRSRKNKPNS